ncbi:hypothetical protein AAFF_G00188220 [Aldrovandia affinis]|uniref:Uncharacterized protein n=1 Tax=Aldrovandia affinis TaxID=143900 RepID=A0AAD7WVT8_9TELE|nr:hypothetical protein AAFF_G00188220 [Aldrovandia affinis]
MGADPRGVALGERQGQALAVRTKGTGCLTGTYIDRENGGDRERIASCLLIQPAFACLNDSIRGFLNRVPTGMSPASEPYRPVHDPPSPPPLPLHLFAQAQEWKCVSEMGTCQGCLSD